jgi:hypothetical protein
MMTIGPALGTTGVFDIQSILCADDRVYGTPVRRGWCVLHVVSSEPMIRRRGLIPDSD